ncbi:MAG: hypothetical protein ABIW82_16430 [Dokdonella sp.]
MVFAFAGILTNTQSARASAENPAIGPSDPAPGATLLFPYFEVDLNSPAGVDTLLTVHNSSATAILSHVTVWTDLGYPVLTFNAYMTGYDVFSLDMRSALVDRTLPRTASAGQDPTDTISHKGMFSQDINFASCNGQLPYATPILTPAYAADLRSLLTGGPATYLSNKCAAASHGDSIARGYVTMETVNNCTQRVPNDPTYFIQDVTYQNVMAGEYFLVDQGNALMHQGPAVAIDSSYNDPSITTPGAYTFYGRMNGWDASDRREPLPTTWAVDTSAERTEAIVWRDPKVQITPFNCSNPGYPAGFPLGQERTLVFDNQEQPQAIAATQPFPLVAQRVTLDPPTSGKPAWAYLGLSFSSVAAGANPPADPLAQQAYVTVLQYPESGATSTGSGAISLDTGLAAQHTHPNP